MKKQPRNARFSSNDLTVLISAKYLATLDSRTAASKMLLFGGIVGTGRLSPRSHSKVDAEAMSIFN